MIGPDVLVASMSVPQQRGGPRAWQYHSRSDLHSKVGCWGVAVDLLASSRLLREHAASGTVVFGVNHTMTDHENARRKNLDLVIATPGGAVTEATLLDLADKYHVVLAEDQRSRVAELPTLFEGPVGAVLVALEAKATMTAHSKARPRLYDELNSSQLTVHGASDRALAVGLVMVNVSEQFISPDLNKADPEPPEYSTHKQPSDAAGVIEKVGQLPRRSGDSGRGFDGIGVVVVSCVNDGVTPVTLHEEPPAPPPGDVHDYRAMISRVASEYDRAFVKV